MIRVYFKIIAFMCLVTASQSVFAQLRDVNLYLQVGGGPGSLNTFNLGGTLMYKKWAVTYDLVRQIRRANNIPANYTPGMSFGPQIFDDSWPQQTMEGQCIEGAHVIYFADRKLRFLARGGVFIGTYTSPVSYEQLTPAGYFWTYYQPEYESYEVVGLVLHPTVEWPVTAPFGASAGIRVIVTGPRTSAAVDFNILLGKVRKARPRIDY